MLKDKKALLPIIGVAVFLVVIFGAAYSFFEIVVNNNTTSTTIESKSDKIGQPILSTKNTLLSITLEAEMMNQSNAGTTYYASLDGTPITSNIALNNGRYILSTASLADGDVSFDCQYSYSVTASVLNEITDGSDANVKVVFTNNEGISKTYTLNEITNGNVVYSGTFTNLTPGVDQNILVEAYIENTSELQVGLAGNEYTFEIVPLKDSAGFSCDFH